MTMELYDVLGRLVLAAVCAAVVGFEREASHKAAGLRTHTLVGVGAALFTVVSIVGFDEADQSRVAAQIVTGIGFLGAGAIFREGHFVKGLTTAAGLWAVAALGMAAGSGRYDIATLGTIVIITVLLGFRVIDAYVARQTRQHRDRLEIVIEETDLLKDLFKFMKRIDESAEQLSFRRQRDGSGVLTMGADPDRSEMLREMLSVHRGIREVELLSPLFFGHERPDDT
ncbi:MAG: MgtC/SapB family protein [Acidimicrobiia bacterium]|nr:MgtC/SapB family protein [Acidimicrobiia bacterium]NNF69605.1 MgtC/SapB family protein [Acidimicrobiia bacterium]